jgi:Na+-transporting methylmalonyl-CoA/oxaloacetate decarboxylase gamma subunit
MNSIIFFAAGANSFAFTLIITGLIVVIMALALLVLAINSIPAIGNFFIKLSKTRDSTRSELVTGKRIPAQVSAAIAAAIYLYLDDIHDKESKIMTIRKVSRTYSPWSSKIYGLNILRK